ncbi:MAG: FkbM family methyltransferase [Myxococcota bacterium]
MRKPILRALSIAAVITFGIGCGARDEAPLAEPSTEDAGAFVDQTQPGPGLGKIWSVIEKERERLRNVTGREGILAEERRYSLFDEELLIRDFFQDRRGGFFLDVGCEWPVRSSNTYYLEKHLGWKGIGIDALAEYGPGWKSERPNSRFFSYLVTDQSGTKETFFKSPNPGLSSTNRKMASGRIFGDDLEPEEVQIYTITLNDLLDREGVTKIDLLSMDIEGHEPKALAGFDIERFQPELVVTERSVVHKKGDGKGKVYRYFERHGYELIEEYLPFDKTNHYFKRKEF